MSETKRITTIRTAWKTVLQPCYLVYVILIVLLVVANIVSPGYLSGYHLLSMLRIASFLGIACIGQNLCMLIGCINMSVAATIMLGNVMGAGVLMGSDANLLAAFLVSLLSGAVVGVLTSIGVNHLRIPPFIMTLGMSSIIEGFAMVYTDGAPTGASSPMLTSFTSMTTVGNLSGVVISWLVLAVAFILLLRYTKIGRNIYALGANPKGAEFSGVNIVRTRTAVFVVASIMCALVGFLLVGYTGTTYLTPTTPPTWLRSSWVVPL